MRLARPILVAVSLTFLPQVSLAHVGTSEAIQEVDARIAAAPTKATLYLERGELHRERGDSRSAFADFDRAGKIAPDLAEVDLHRGRLQLDLGQLERARASLTRYLGRRPDVIEGVIQHARLLAACGEPLPAAAGYARAIELAGAGGGRPSPDLFVFRARALLAAGPRHRAAAVAALDDGYRRLGATALAALALDVVIDLGEWDEALGRIDALAARSARQEGFHARRGEVLVRAGRPAEAAKAYTRALAAIGELAPARRETRAVRALEGKVRAALAKLPEEKR
jgi:tetratricopeptide (TPR) repeat protein